MNNLEKRLDYLRRLLGRLYRVADKAEKPVVTSLHGYLLRSVAADEGWLQGFAEAVEERRFGDYTNDVIELCWDGESVIEFNDGTELSEIIVQHFVPTYRLVNPETLFGSDGYIGVKDKIQRLISTWAVSISTFDELLRAYSLRLDVDKETSWADFGRKHIVIRVHEKRPIVIKDFHQLIAWATFIYGGHYFTWALCPESIFRDKITAKVAVEDNSKLFRDDFTDKVYAYDSHYAMFRSDALLAAEVVLANAGLTADRISETLLTVYKDLETQVDDCKKRQDKLRMLVRGCEAYSDMTKRTLVRYCVTTIIVSVVLSSLAVIIAIFYS